MKDHNNKEMHQLVDYIDAWFFEYFTSNNFDTPDEMSSAVLRLIDNADSNELMMCKKYLLSDCNLTEDYIESNSVLIICHLKNTGNTFLKNMLSLIWRV